MAEIRLTTRQKQSIFECARGCCEYCHSQARFATHAFSTEMIGLTPTGRATIETLHLNRAELINLRRVLYALGEHPLSETAARY